MKFDKHILFFSPGFPANEQEGSCLPAVQNFIRCFQEQFPDWEITVLSLHYPFKKQSYQWNQIRVIALGGKNRPYPGRFLLWRQALREIARLHAAKPIDIIHSFWMHECGMLGNYFSRIHNIPQFITLMGQDLKPPNRFVRFINQKEATLVALSEFQPLRQQTGIRKPDAVIPFGIPLREKDWVTPAPKIVDLIGVGSLIPLKNYPLFLDVVALLKKHKPDLHAEIIGEGVHRPLIEAKIARLGLDKNVTLMGELSRKDIYASLSRSKVFLHTSDYESQGYVFNEALMAGIPIVSTPVGIAHPEKYWSIETEAAGMAKKILHFWESPVSIPADRQYNMEETVVAYENLYCRSLKSTATIAATKK